MTAADRIRAFIREMFFVDQFSNDESFLQAGIIDSTGMLDLVAFVERAFEIRVEDSEMLPDNLDSLDNLTRFIERKRARIAGT
jgi:acyl carrier protein